VCDLYGIDRATFTTSAAPFFLNGADGNFWHQSGSTHLHENVSAANIN
jgi:hypothetical protein